MATACCVERRTSPKGCRHSSRSASPSSRESSGLRETSTLRKRRSIGARGDKDLHEGHGNSAGSSASRILHSREVLGKSGSNQLWRTMTEYTRGSGENGR